MEPMVEYATPKQALPGIVYRYSLAFLDSQPNPEVDHHVFRLVRLMAYDMALGAGKRGSDAAGVFAIALRGLHATRGKMKDQWEWEFDGMIFSARPAPCELLPEISLPDTHQEKVSLSSFEWLNKFQELPVPDPYGSINVPKPKSYPDPEHTIEAACLLCLEVATLLCNVKQVKVCLLSEAGSGVEISLDTSKFKPKPARRHSVNPALYK